MYPINDVILDAFRSQSREFEVKVRINNGVELTGENIIDYKISDSILPDNNFALGTTCSAKLELNMLLPENSSLALERAKLEMFVGVKIEGVAQYVPMGVYYVDNVETKDNYKTVHITAFDAMLKIGELGNTYIYDLSGYVSVSPLEIITNICDKADVPFTTPRLWDYVDKHEVRHGEKVEYDSHGNIFDVKAAIGFRDKIKLPKLDKNNFDVELFVPTEVLPFFDNDRDLMIPTYDTDGKYTGRIKKKFNDPDVIITDSPLGKTFKMNITILPTPCEIGMFMYSVLLPDELSVNGCTFDVIYKDKQYNFPEESTKVKIPANVKYNISPREMLGYMASLLGMSAKIDREGELILKKLTSSSGSVLDNYSILRSDQVMNGLTKSTMSPLTIDYLVTGTENTSTEQNNTILAGEGTFGFNFSNPFITDTKVANGILDIYKYQLFYPMSLNIIGNPYLEVGDYINVEDRDGNLIPTIVLSLETKVSGGFRQSIKCQPDLKNNNRLISNPTTQTISRKNSSFMELYQSLINALVGVDGGYVKLVYDSQKKVRAIAIPLNDVELKWEDNQSGHGGKVVTVKPVSGRVEPMWVFSGGGLAFTNDGGRTYEVAMNTQGQIFANYLLSPEGNIGGWTIRDDALYNDQIVTTISGEKTYRSFLQGARNDYDEDTWVYSVQEKRGNSFYGNWVVKASGDMFGKDWNFDAEGNLENKSIILSNRNDPTIRIYLRAPDPDDSVAFAVTQYGVNPDGQAGYHPVFMVQKDGTTSIINADLSCGDIGCSKVTCTAISTEQTSSVSDTPDISTGNVEAWGWVKAIDGLYTGLLKKGGASYSRYGGIDAESNLDMINSDIYMRGNSDIFLKGAGSQNLPLYSEAGTGMITVSSSSERYKENIKPIGLEKDPTALYDLPVKQFNYKKEFEKQRLTIDNNEIGLIAEDVDKIYPTACVYNTEGKPENWQERIMIPAMLKLIQDQHKEIEDLKTRLDKLEKGDKK